MDSINFLPTEVIYHIFSYLSPKDLAHAGEVCKHFYDIGQHEDLPGRLMTPKLKPEIIRDNAQILWNYPQGVFNVGLNGRLKRLIAPHLSDQMEEIDHYEVNKTIAITLNEIFRLNRQGTFKVQDKSSKPSRFYVWKNCKFYASYYPADYLANQILNSSQQLNASIMKAAKRLIEQADLYKKNHTKYLTLQNCCQDKRILLSGKEIKEAFFWEHFI